MPLYRGMDRAALDAAYNNGAAVKESARIVAEWEAMLGIYERMASAELKPRVKRRHEQVIGVSAHH